MWQCLLLLLFLLLLLHFINLRLLTKIVVACSRVCVCLCVLAIFGLTILARLEANFGVKPRLCVPPRSDLAAVSAGHTNGSWQCINQCCKGARGGGGGLVTWQLWQEVDLATRKRHSSLSREFGAKEPHFV